MWRAETDRQRSHTDKQQQSTLASDVNTWETHPRLSLSPPLHTVGEEIEVSTLPLSQERVPELQHVAVHYTVLTQSVVCTQTNTVRMSDRSFVLFIFFLSIIITLLVAQLLVLCPLASLVLVRVQVDRLVDRLCHFLLPALWYDQRKVLVQLLITVQQLKHKRVQVVQKRHRSWF